MSRSGYIDDCDCDDILAAGRYQAALNSAIKGRRGQAFLRELLAALDAMPVKELIAEELVTEGSFCALGVVGDRRGIDMTALDPEDAARVGATFGIAESMAREIVYQNDECVNTDEWIKVEFCGPIRPWYPEWGQHVREVCVPARNVEARRWRHVRSWVEKQLKALPGPLGGTTDAARSET